MQEFPQQLLTQGLIITPFPKQLAHANPRCCAVSSSFVDHQSPSFSGALYRLKRAFIHVHGNLSYHFQLGPSLPYVFLKFLVIVVAIIHHYTHVVACAEELERNVM